jgi:hypothetical protein
MPTWDIKGLKQSIKFIPAYICDYVLLDYLNVFVKLPFVQQIQISNGLSIRFMNIDANDEMGIGT